MLRHGGHCPDASNGTANTWLAFLDIESFFDRVWRHGLLHKLWTAGMRGKAFMLCCSYLELTTIVVIVEGRISDSWESALGLLQGSVLSMLLPALYLSPLQHFLERAEHGSRWTTHDCHAVRTNSRFYVDDGLLPARKKPCNECWTPSPGGHTSGAYAFV